MSDSSSNHVMSEISNRAIIFLSGNLAVSFGAPFSPKPGFVRELDPVRIPVMFGLESNLSGKQTAPHVREFTVSPSLAITLLSGNKIMVPSGSCPDFKFRLPIAKHVLFGK